MTRERDVDALAAAIRRLIEAVIAGDQGRIGVHQDLTNAQAGLRDALRAVLVAKVKERADELRLARAYRDEAEQIKKAAEQDLEAARYERGQAEHRLRTAEDNLRAAAECKRWLEQHDEAAVRAQVAAADKALAEAKALMASYDNEKHAAAIYLRQEAEREKAEREQSAA
jgi:hypothetical protein